jgi:hypothetical protein
MSRGVAGSSAGEPGQVPGLRSMPFMAQRWPEIGSAAEFVRLRSSADPAEYERAAWAEMPMSVWLELIREYPEMRHWAAHNKTVPIEILDVLAGDSDPAVRGMVAMKRKLTPQILERLAGDPDEAVRMSVARHRRTPRSVLLQLREDPWPEIRRVVAGRLGTASGDASSSGERAPSG